MTNQFTNRGTLKVFSCNYNHRPKFETSVYAAGSKSEIDAKVDELYNHYRGLFKVKVYLYLKSKAE